MEKEKLLKKALRMKLSDMFADFRVELVPIPQYPMYDMICDMPMHTIWINTAADQAANICRLEPEKW